MKSLILVAVGGAVGSVVRWTLARLLDRWLAAAWLPPGILLVNVMGCLAIGLVLGSAARGLPAMASESARLLLAVGVCGGFTTFSSFSQQALSLLTTGRPGAALAYVGLSVGLGLAATAAGWWIVRP